MRLPPRPVGTIRYWSPNHRGGAPTQKDDWWAVGLIIHEALHGRHWFDDAVERLEGGADYDKVTRILNGDERPPIAPIDRRWDRLLKGLLDYDARDRWGLDEVRAWLAGRGPMPTPTPDDPTRPTETALFAGMRYDDPVALGTAMRANWEAGEAFTIDVPSLRNLETFARRRGSDDLAAALHHLRNDFELSDDPVPPSRRLVAVSRLLDPASAPEFRGRSVALRHLSAIAISARQGSESATQHADRDFLRLLFGTDALYELAQLDHPEAAGLAAVRDGWIANEAIIERLRIDGGMPHNVLRILGRGDRRRRSDPSSAEEHLLAEGLYLTFMNEDQREAYRVERLVPVGEDDPVILNQPWFALLVQQAWHGLPDGQDARGGQVTAMSSLLARMLYHEAQLAERRAVDAESADEPNFPDTPGGRREDVDYAAPENLVGLHPVVPRPSYPRYDPAAIFGRQAGTTPRKAAGQLFRVLAVLGGAIAALGIVRLFWLDHAQSIDVRAPLGWADGMQGTLLNGVMRTWAEFHSAWMTVSPFAAIDPLTAAGAWVPGLVGVALIGIAVAASRSILPLPTQFKPAPTPRRYVAEGVTYCVVAVLILIVLLPWTIAMALPLLIAILVPAKFV